MGLLWDAIRESTSSPKDKILAVGSAFTLAAILLGLCYWAGEGCFHVSNDLDPYTTRRAVSRSTIMLGSVAVASGVGALGLCVLGLIMLVGRGKPAEG
ncbi:MAG: hypothetical protein DHS20C14_09500 [Phycisphaeraceae bacterium]|nr:MAG: hypothetical protein DHS20C14_09500 [Phycisphaeraceae bacterium]